MSISQNFPNTRPSLNLNFARSKTLDPRITFTRTTSGTRVGPDGYIEVIPADQPRFDFDPVTGECLGLLIEEGRQNLVRNNTAQGAVVGTPGTAPTNSYFYIFPSGISREITAIGVENGITYFDVRYYGTSASTGEISWAPQVATLSPVTVGQTVSASVYLKVVSGDFTSIGSLSIRVLDYGPGYLRESSTPYSTSLLQSPTLLRYSHTRTTGASTTGVVFSITLNKTASGPVDVTLRIGMPQIEVGSFPTSVIPTFGTAVTRTADNASITGSNFTEWYNPSEGTIVLSAISRMPDTHTLNRSFAIFGDGTYTYQTGFYKKVGIAIMRPVISNVELTGTTLTKDLSFKAALSMSSSLNQFCYNGSFISSSSTPIPSQIDRIHFYDITGAGIGHPTATISSFQYYPTRLPNAQLQTLTK